MRAEPRRRFLTHEPEPRRGFKGQRTADRDAFAVQKPLGIARGRLQRMAESMAEIEQRAFALLGLVARHDIGLHLHRAAHRLLPQRHIARRQSRDRTRAPKAG
jgi:hypothetical protein